MKPIPPFELDTLQEFLETTRNIPWEDVKTVLVFGSGSTIPSEPLIELDLIVLTTTPRSRQIYATVNGTDLDIFAGSMEHFGEKIRQRANGNNNFALRAFCMGTVLHSKDDDFEQLRTEALKIWNAGPSLITARRKAILIYQQRKMIGTLRKRMARGQMDGIFELECGHYLHFCIDAHCELARLWSTSIREIWSKGSTDLNEVSHYLEVYLACKTVKSRAEIIMKWFKEISDKLQNMDPNE